MSTNWCPACGQAIAPRARFTPPTPAERAPHFPALEVRALVGHGEMGAVSCSLGLGANGPANSA